MSKRNQALEGGKMTWLGELAGEIAGTIFPGARAIVTKVANRTIEDVVRAAKKYVERWLDTAAPGAPFNRAALADAERSEAVNLAEEEKDLAKKFAIDKKRTPADADRIQEIQAARDKLHDRIRNTNAVRSAEDLAGADSLISVNTTPDELASQVGILSVQECPSCNGIMTLKLGNSDSRAGQKFMWSCTRSGTTCRVVYLRPAELAKQVSIRQPSADFDQPNSRKDWEERSVLARTAGRVRSHLGHEDEATMCPTHLLPMKLLQTANAGGRLLDTYQYTCLGVDARGRACRHTLPLKSFGQVSSLLTRVEGRGIL